MHRRLGGDSVGRRYVTLPPPSHTLHDLIRWSAVHDGGATGIREQCNVNAAVVCSVVLVILGIPGTAQGSQAPRHPGRVRCYTIKSVSQYFTLDSVYV